MRLPRRALPGLLLALAARRRSARAAPGPDPGVPYRDPDPLARLPFGAHSHWIQPWRAAGATCSAARLARGVGVVLDGADRSVAPEAFTLLARSGIRTVRIEVNWGGVDFATESRLDGQDALTYVLEQCRRTGLRPLILLNAHEARPTPSVSFEATVGAAARRGDRSVVLLADGTIVPGHTGLTDPADGVAAGTIIAAVERPRLILSRPLPMPLQAGSRVTLTTLRYRPFSAPGSADMNATLAGWLRYVDLVAGIATAALGTKGAANQGFDLEIWNELTFASRFLSLANYYDPPPAPYPAEPDAIWAEIVDRTAAHVETARDRFAGVGICNGFAATTPFIAAGRQPRGVVAISKHPYPPLLTYPADDERGPSLDGSGRPAAFVPRYRVFFPEYLSTALQTETLWRDIAPAANPIYDQQHGVTARPAAQGGPVAVWLTEMGVGPEQYGVSAPAAAERLRARFGLRSVLFHLGIGAERVYLFQAFGGGGGPPDMALVATPDGRHSSLALEVLGRALRCIAGAGGDVAALRELEFRIHPGLPTGTVFAGNGDPATPALLNRDCLVLLPVQSAADRMVLIHYVMTRDIRDEMAPERVRIAIAGLGRPPARIRAYDPMTDTDVAVARRDGEDGTLELELLAADTPRLLVMEELGA